MVGHVRIKSRSATLQCIASTSFVGVPPCLKYFLPPFCAYAFHHPALCLRAVINLAELQKTKKALSSLRRLSSKSYLVWLLKDLIYFHCISLRKQVEVSIYFLIELYCDHVNYTNIRCKCYVLRKS